VAAVLLFSAFVISTCGLVYELIAGALASYLMGDSVTQFSTVIGVYLFAMGVGSYLSKFINRNLLTTFVQLELLVGVVGGTSAALLFVAFERAGFFRVLLYTEVFLTGALVGMEIPLLMRILKDEYDFKELISKVFTFDYIGALLASLLFPLILVPHLGLVRSAFLFGILNILVGMATLFIFKMHSTRDRLLLGTSIFCLVGLLIGMVGSDSIVRFAEAATYPDPIVFAKTTPYQRIVVTRSTHDYRLYLNNNLQFSSLDEYRYHEALVHVGMASLDAPRDILVLGGGDGMAVREVLKYPSIQSVTLVDLDSGMTELFSSQTVLANINAGSLTEKRVQVITEDAFLWLKKNQRTFDFVVLDFPDPSNFTLGKLYSTAFYRELFRAVSPSGLAVIQSTSPFVARRSFWCVDKTLQTVGFKTTPYHTMVPSFGEWGFIIAGKHPFQKPTRFIDGLKFMSPETLETMLSFPKDMNRVETEVNRLNNQALVRYFEDEWGRYLR